MNNRLKRSLSLFFKILLVPLFFIFMSVLSLVVLLYTETGSRWIASKVVFFYNNIIEGKVEDFEFNGTLGKGFEFSQVHLKDQNDNTLLKADKIRLQWSLFDFLKSKGLDLEVSLNDSEIFLGADYDAKGFIDLIPVSEKDKTKEPVKFSLPIKISINLSLNNIKVSVLNKQQPFASEINIKAFAEGQGLKAQLEVKDINGILHNIYKNESLEIANSSLSVLRNDDFLTMNNFELKTNWLDVKISKAEVDLSLLQIKISLISSIKADKLKEISSFNFSKNPVLNIEFKGSPRGFQAGVDVALDEKSKLALIIDGALEPLIDLKMQVSVVDFDPLVFLGKEPGNSVLTAKGEVEIQGKNFDLASIEGKFECEHCYFKDIGLIETSITAKINKGYGEVKFELGALDVTAEALARINNYKPEVFEFDATIKKLETLIDPFSQMFELPSIKGAAKVSGKCQGERFLCQAEVSTEGIAVDSVKTRTMKLEASLEPFEPNLPFKANLTANNLRIDKTNLGNLFLKAEGDKSFVATQINSKSLGQHHVKADLKVHFEPFILIDARALDVSYKGLRAFLKAPAKIKIEGQKIEVDSLDLDILEGSLRVAGLLDLEKTSNFTLDINKVNLNRLSSIYKGHVFKGELEASASIKGKMDSFLGGAKLEINDLFFDEIKIGDLFFEASYRRNRLFGLLQLKNGIAKNLNIDFMVDADFTQKKVDKMFPLKGERSVRAKIEGLKLNPLAVKFFKFNVKGTLDVNANLEGTGYDPQISMQVDLERASWNDLALGKFSAKASYHKQVANLDFKAITIPVEEIALIATIPLKIENQISFLPNEIHRAQLNIKKANLAANFALLEMFFKDFHSPPVLGLADLVLDFEGTLNKPKVDAYAEVQDFRVRQESMGKAIVRAKATSEALSFHAQIMESQNQYVNLKLLLPYNLKVHPFSFEFEPHKRHEIKAYFAGLDNSLISVFTPIPQVLDFRLSGKIDGKGSLDKFLVDGSWHGYLSLPYENTFRLNGSLRAVQNKQHFDLKVGSTDNPIITLSGATSVFEGFKDQTTFSPQKMPIDLNLTLTDLSLKPYSKLLPNSLHRLEGVLEGKISAKGTVEDFSTKGKLRFKNGAVTVSEFNQRLRGLGFDVLIEDKNISVEKLSFRSGSGKGTGKMSASLDSDNKVTGSGEIKLSRFPFVRPGLPQVLINSKILTSLSTSEKDVDIKIDFLKTDLRLIDMSGQPAPRDIRKGTRTNITHFGQDEKSSDKEVKEPRTVRLSVNMDSPIEIRGQGVQMRWMGNMAIVSGVSHNTITGGIQALPGRFELLGNLFEIETGQINFPQQGSMDPFIDLTAKTNTPEAVITVTIRGRVSSPELILSSEPFLTQYQIVSLLTTGRSEASGPGGDEIDVTSSVASLLLAFNNPTLERQAYERLGIDKIGIAMGDSLDEPILVVGKRFGNIYVETRYHYNASLGDNTRALRVEYRITPSWAVETEYGDAQKGEVGIVWQKRFDRQKNDKPSNIP